jgi:hypothetical protein
MMECQVSTLELFFSDDNADKGERDGSIKSADVATILFLADKMSARSVKCKNLVNNMRLADPLIKSISLIYTKMTHESRSSAFAS